MRRFRGFGGLMAAVVLTSVVAVSSAAGAATPPPTAANQRYVRAAYLDLMFRPPNPEELSETVARLDGGATRSSFVTELANSAEWVEKLVDQMYFDTLGRPGDRVGRNYWANEIRTGRRSVASVAASFYASAEYFDGIGGGTNRTWIGDLYPKLLQRQADPAGLTYWEGQTARKGRLSVAFTFYQSLESRRTRVRDLYSKLLNRGTDAAGLDYWAKVIATKGDIALAASLASSSEYFNFAQFTLQWSGTITVQDTFTTDYFPGSTSKRIEGTFELIDGRLVGGGLFDTGATSSMKYEYRA